MLANGGVIILRSKGQMSRLLGTKNVKIFFSSYLPQKWIDLRQNKTKVITGPSHTHIVEYISPAKRIILFDICLFWHY